MAYLSKNGVKGVEISNGAMNGILEAMADVELLREPILEEIERKKKINDKADVEALKEVLAELERKPVDFQRFKEKLAKVSSL